MIPFLIINVNPIHKIGEEKFFGNILREILLLTPILVYLEITDPILIAVVCINSMKSYSGVDGLEVGQSIIISCSMILQNFIVKSKKIALIVS